MGSCSVNFDTDFLKTLSNLEDTDELSTKILDETKEIIVKAEKSAITHVDTGEMRDSIKATKVKKNQWGHYVSIRPTGKDKKGTRNMEKFVYNEYGTSNQIACPIQLSVVDSTSDEIIEKAQQIINSKVVGS